MHIKNVKLNLTFLIYTTIHTHLGENMRKIIQVVTILLLISMSISTSSIAGEKQGQRLYKKKFHKECGFSGVTFARHYLSAEWENIYEAGKFPEEAKNICPNLNIERIEKRQWKDVYEFSVKYAKDGVPPNGCND